MGDYTIVSEISNAFVKLLQTYLVPEVIQNPEEIALCSPSDKGDAALGIFLYDIKENDDFRVNEMISSGVNLQKYPSLYLDLYYMITSYSTSDIKYRSVEEQRTIGKVIQILNDHSAIEEHILDALNIVSNLDIQVEMLRLDTEEKIKLWSTPNQPYKLSVFYKISPVELESLKEKRISRVVDMDFTVKE